MRLVFGVVFTAVVMFVYSYGYWDNVPKRLGVMHSLPDDSPVVKTLDDAKLPTGMYFHPVYSPDLDKLSPEERAKAKEAVEERQKKGPFYAVLTNTEGFDMIKTMAMSFGHMALCALLLGVLTWRACSGCGFACRWMFIVSIAVIASLWIDPAQVIWFRHPWDYQLLHAGYHVSAWIVAGIPLAMGTGRPAAPAA
jgi:hypothetical protein